MISEAQEHNLRNRPVADSLNKCFLTAHLITGSSIQAEKAVMEAIDHWDPDEGDKSRLFRLTLESALKSMIAVSRPGSDEECSADFLPDEMRRVLELPPNLRCCFVIRILAGLALLVCSQLLHLGVHQIDQYCCDAMKSLASLTYSFT